MEWSNGNFILKLLLLFKLQASQSSDIYVCVCVFMLPGL